MAGVHDDEEPVITIQVFQAEDGRFYAAFDREQDAGAGDYSETVIGAISELLCLLMDVDRDRITAES